MNQLKKILTRKKVKLLLNIFSKRLSRLKKRQMFGDKNCIFSLHLNEPFLKEFVLEKKINNEIFLNTDFGVLPVDFSIGTKKRTGKKNPGRKPWHGSIY